MNKEELKTLVKIDESDLSGEAASLAERFVYLYELFADANNNYDLHVEAVSAATGAAYLQHRSDLIATGAKPTDALVNNLVACDPTVNKLVEKKIQLKKEKDFLYGLVKAMETKKEMVKTLSFLRKDDMRYD